MGRDGEPVRQAGDVPRHVGRRRHGPPGALLADARPDLIGSVTAWYPGGEYIEAAYFTSEDDARAGERKEMTPEMAERFARFQDLWHVDRYLDISEPWLIRA